MEELHFQIQRGDNEPDANTMILLKYGTILTFLAFIFIYCQRFEIATTKHVRGKEVSIV